MTVPAASGSQTGARRSGNASRTERRLDEAEARSTAVELRSLRTDLRDLASALQTARRESHPGRKRTWDALRFFGVLMVATLLALQMSMLQHGNDAYEGLLRTLHSVCEQRNQDLTALRYLTEELARVEANAGGLASERIAIYGQAHAMAGPPPDCDRRFPLP